MNLLQTAVAVVVAGALLVAGVAGLFGVWWALIAAAGWITVAAVLLYDPAKPSPKRSVRKR